MGDPWRSPAVLVAALAITGLAGAGPAPRTALVPDAPRLSVGTTCTLRRKGWFTSQMVVHEPSGDRAGIGRWHHTEVIEVRVVAADHRDATRLRVHYRVVDGAPGSRTLDSALRHRTFLVTRGAGAGNLPTVTEHGAPLTGEDARRVRNASYLLMPPLPLRAALHEALSHPGNRVELGRKVLDRFQVELGPHTGLRAYSLRLMGVRRGVARLQVRKRAAFHHRRSRGTVTRRSTTTLDAHTGLPLSVRAVERMKLHGALPGVDRPMLLDDTIQGTIRQTVACRPGTG